MHLDCGTVSFHSEIIIHFERDRSNDHIILTLDKITLKRSLSVDHTLNKKVKVITDSEKMDIMNAIQLLNSDKIPSKVVITRTVYKEYTFIESMYHSLKELLFKSNKWSLKYIVYCLRTKVDPRMCTKSLFSKKSCNSTTVKEIIFSMLSVEYIEFTSRGPKLVNIPVIKGIKGLKSHSSTVWPE